MSSHLLLLLLYFMSGSPVALLLVLHHSRLFHFAVWAVPMARRFAGRYLSSDKTALHLSSSFKHNVFLTILKSDLVLKVVWCARFPKCLFYICAKNHDCSSSMQDVGLYLPMRVSSSVFVLCRFLWFSCCGFTRVEVHGLLGWSWESALSFSNVVFSSCCHVEFVCSRESWLSLDIGWVGHGYCAPTVARRKWFTTCAWAGACPREAVAVMNGTRSTNVGSDVLMTYPICPSALNWTLVWQPCA